MRARVVLLVASLFLIPAAQAALPAYALSSGSATSNIDTTGAKLILIQCNSFGAACHTSTFADSASNTYTAGTRHTNANFNITWFWVINPTTSATENWTASGSDTIYVSVYGAPSGGTSWLADSGATGYDTSVNESANITTITLTPTVTGDIISTGISDNQVAVAVACNLTSPGGTNAAPIVFTGVCNPSTTYIYAEPFTVAGVTPSAYNGSYVTTALSSTTITANNGSPPGSAWVSGGTITGSVQWASTPSGSCQFNFQNQYNTNTAKEDGASFDTVACNSTSAQVISWAMNTGNYIISAIAFKPVLSASSIRHKVVNQ